MVSDERPARNTRRPWHSGVQSVINATFCMISDTCRDTRMEGRCVLEVGRSVVALAHRDAPAGVLCPTNKSCLGPRVRITEWLSAASDKSVSVSVPTSTPSGCVAPLGGSSISRPQRAASLCADRVQALPCEVGRRCSPRTGLCQTGLAMPESGGGVPPRHSTRAHRHCILDPLFVRHSASQAQPSPRVLDLDDESIEVVATRDDHDCLRQVADALEDSFAILGRHTAEVVPVDVDTKPPAPSPSFAILPSGRSIETTVSEASHDIRMQPHGCLERGASWNIPALRPRHLGGLAHTLQVRRRQHRSGRAVTMLFHKG